MVTDQQFLREYAYARHGNYPRHQVVWSQPIMDKFARFPMNCWNYNRISSDADDRSQGELQEGWNSYVTSVRSKFSGNINPRSASWSYINPRLVSGDSCNKLDDEPKLRQDVSAFGPKHAEHARRFYQETGQSVVLFPTCRLTYDPVGVSYNDVSQANRGESVLEQPAFGAVNHGTFFNLSATGRVPVNVASDPRENVLKVAMISSRPKVKRQYQPKAELALGEMKHRKRSDDSLSKKSIDFQGMKNLLGELSKAPLFQILCEISNTK